MERFNYQNLTLMNAIDSLHPKSKQFLMMEPLLPLYEHYNISSESLENELCLFKEVFAQAKGSPDKRHLGDVLEMLLPLETAFPNLKKGSRIAMTFDVSSATVERSFSSFRKIKTYDPRCHTVV